MPTAKPAAVRRSVTLPRRHGLLASRKTNRLAVPLRRYSQSWRSIYPGSGATGGQPRRSTGSGSRRSTPPAAAGPAPRRRDRARPPCGRHTRRRPARCTTRLEVGIGRARAQDFARQALVRGQLDHLAGEMVKHPAGAALGRVRVARSCVFAREKGGCVAPPSVRKRPKEKSLASDVANPRRCDGPPAKMRLLPMNRMLIERAD